MLDPPTSQDASIIRMTSDHEITEEEHIGRIAQMRGALKLDALRAVTLPSAVFGAVTRRLNARAVDGQFTLATVAGAVEIRRDGANDIEFESACLDCGAEHPHHCPASESASEES